VVSTEESEFCEKFNEYFTIPHNFPAWLWGGPPVSFRRHPTLMKLKLPTQKSKELEKEEQKREMEEYKKRMNGKVLGEEEAMYRH
jgi:hypothetical protein